MPIKHFQRVFTFLFFLKMATAKHLTVGIIVSSSTFYTAALI